MRLRERHKTEKKIPISYLAEIHLRFTGPILNYALSDPMKTHYESVAQFTRFCENLLVTLESLIIFFSPLRVFVTENDEG